MVERARVASERKALSARDARGSSQVSFDLYLVRAVFLYFSWNGMRPQGAKSILKSFKKKKRGKRSFYLNSQEIKYLLNTGSVSHKDNGGKPEMMNGGSKVLQG